MDYRTPSEAVYIPPISLQLTGYKEEATLALSSTRANAAKSIQKAQQQYKQVDITISKDQALQIQYLV